MQESILILDFGSQYTQLIARRVRELNVYSEIIPWNAFKSLPEGCRGVVLSGSPHSVRDTDAPNPDLSAIIGKVPLLGCAMELSIWRKPTVATWRRATLGSMAVRIWPR